MAGGVGWLDPVDERVAELFGGSVGCRVFAVEQVRGESFDEVEVELGGVVPYQCQERVEGCCRFLAGFGPACRDIGGRRDIGGCRDPVWGGEGDRVDECVVACAVWGVGWWGRDRWGPAGVGGPPGDERRQVWSVGVAVWFAGHLAQYGLQGVDVDPVDTAQHPAVLVDGLPGFGEVAVLGFAGRGDQFG